MRHPSGWIVSRHGNADEAQMLGKQAIEASESGPSAGMSIAVASWRGVLR
jgi:hypothetical protein